MKSITDFQATQQIISLLEESKERSEETLDSLPGIYAVVDQNGFIVKGNNTLAAALGVEHEGVLGLHLGGLFSADDWQSFRGMQASLAGTDSAGTEFQADIVVPGKDPRNFLWLLRPVASRIAEAAKLVSVYGRDVTELKLATAQNTRMKLELDMAKLVQDTLFPAPYAEFGAWSVAGYSVSATECGGDWWHYCEIQNKAVLWIGDVTGHGVSAALVTSAMKAAVGILKESFVGPSESLRVLNRAVLDTTQDMKWVTFLIMSIDLETGECALASAAHEMPILIPGDRPIRNERDLKFLESIPSSPLGSAASIGSSDRTIKLAPGDRLFLYTDGLFDVVNASGAKWGRYARHELASLSSSNRGVREVVDGLKDAMERYRQGVDLPDDVTFLVFHYGKK